jgi:hypothetical protein
MADGLDLSDILRRTVQANAKFYKGWMDLSFEYFRGISEILGGTNPTEGTAAADHSTDSGASALVMEGDVGDLVRGAFLVTNDLDRPVSCEFVTSDFKDPRGTAALAQPSFEPAKVELAPGEQRVIQVALTIDDSLSPGVGYAAEFCIRGMDGFSVPVVLRRRHRVDDSSGRSDQPVTDQSDLKTDAPAKTRRKAAKKGSGTKKSR